MTMDIIFDNGAKRENQIAGAFLKFYLPTILQIDKDVLDVQDAEKLVSTGSKPDYYIPSIGMLLEISTLVDKESIDESAKAKTICKELERSIYECDLSGLSGFWSIAIPYSFWCRRDELGSIVSAIVDAIRMRRTSVCGYPMIELSNVSDGPLDLDFGGRTGDGDEACNPPWATIADNMKKIEKANQQLSTEEIDGVKRRMLLFRIDTSLAFPQVSLGWFKQQRTELLTLSSIDEIWLYDAEKNRFACAFRR